MNKLKNKKMTKIDITPSKEAIDLVIKMNQGLINDSLKFLSEFSEDEYGNMTDEVYFRCQKLGVNELAINYLRGLVLTNQYDLNHLYED